MIYPQLCCVTRKRASVKLLPSLCLQRSLCALCRPSGAPVCYFCPTVKRSVPVAPRRTACNRTPHCRAAPQTMCLRSLSLFFFFRGRWGCQKKQNHAEIKKKKKEEERKKTVLQLRGCAQESAEWRWTMSPALLSSVTAAHLTSAGVLMAEECAPTLRVHSSSSSSEERRDVAGGAQLSCRWRRGIQPR